MNQKIGKLPQFVIGLLLIIAIYIVSIMYFKIPLQLYSTIGFWGMIISCGIGLADDDPVLFGAALGCVVMLI